MREITVAGCATLSSLLFEELQSMRADIRSESVLKHNFNKAEEPLRETEVKESKTRHKKAACRAKCKFITPFNQPPHFGDTARVNNLFRAFADLFHPQLCVISLRPIFAPGTRKLFTN